MTGLVLEGTIPHCPTQSVDTMVVPWRERRRRAYREPRQTPYWKRGSSDDASQHDLRRTPWTFGGDALATSDAAAIWKYRLSGRLIDGGPGWLDNCAGA